MWRSVADLVRAAIRRQNILKSDARINSEECKQVCSSEYNIFPLEKAVEKCKRHVNDNYEEKKQYDEREEKLKDCPRNWESSWFGALGWSSALVLGWYMSQPLCWRRFLRGRGELRLDVDKLKCCSMLDMVSRFALNQPLELPRLTQPPVTLVSDEDCVNVPHGPVTAQQAVDEAAEKFVEVQNDILGAVENSKGVRLMEAGEHKKAIAFFKRASAFQSARAAYNLGVCYEKGIGTSCSLEEAARWYELASSRGHAGAMYNLGVFYVHGLGDLTVDRGRAKQLFESAAKLGQPDAARALAKIRQSIRAEHSAKDSKALYEVLGVEVPVSSKLNETAGLRSLQVSEGMLQALGLGPQSEMLNLAFCSRKLSDKNSPITRGDGGIFLRDIVQPVSFCKSEILDHLPSTVYASYIRA